MIESYTFGKIVVAGKTYTHDIKIIHGEVIPEWWRKSGHRLVIHDISDFLEASPDVLVIGCGHSGMMKIEPAVRDALAKARIQLIDDHSAEAVRIFNRRHGRGENVAAGFHLTC